MIDRVDVHGVNDAVKYFLERCAYREIAVSAYDQVMEFVNRFPETNRINFRIGSGTLISKDHKSVHESEQLVLKVAENGETLTLIFPKNKDGKFQAVINPQTYRIESIQASNASVDKIH